MYTYTINAETSHLTTKKLLLIGAYLKIDTLVAEIFTTMNEADLIDHSPSQPEAADRIPTASNVVLIDNFDSFTWK